MISSIHRVRLQEVLKKIERQKLSLIVEDLDEMSKPHDRDLDMTFIKLNDGDSGDDDENDEDDKSRGDDDVSDDNSYITKDEEELDQYGLPIDIEYKEKEESEEEKEEEEEDEQEDEDEEKDEEKEEGEDEQEEEEFDFSCETTDEEDDEIDKLLLDDDENEDDVNSINTDEIIDNEDVYVDRFMFDDESQVAESDGNESSRKKCTQCKQIIDESTQYYKSKNLYDGIFKDIHFCGPKTSCFEEYNEQQWNHNFRLKKPH
jgi:hypothetical protein